MAATGPMVPVAGATSGPVAISIGKLLEGGHYDRARLNDEVSLRLLNNYLEMLDYRRMYFTQEDINALREKYGSVLDDDILLGNTRPAVEISNLYRKRVEERIAKVLEWIETEKFDFKSERVISINRQKADWPKDAAEADQLWKDWLENEFLQLSLDEKTKAEKAEKAEKEAKAAKADKGEKEPEKSEKVAKQPEKSPKESLTRRYKRVLKLVEERTDQEAISDFLSALAQTYDPHSDYMDPEETKNFNINMSLSLTGIGAVLQADNDGYVKIIELVPGGPAAKDGRLRVGDRLSGVAQGEDEMIDIVDMRLDKVVQKIRGPKGTVVKLEVIPTDSSDPGARKVIDISRDEVALKDSEAKAEVIEQVDASGKVQRLGWITLPSFYADMRRAGQPDARSATRDVSILLKRLKKEGISGLVFDLRKNGGGSLEEAINLTGLFVKGTPVVQVKNAQGSIRAYRHHADKVAYEGPMIVLTNTLSASASEIFAAAMQDYGRAVIVGDRHTFGKGTVQTTVDINRHMPFLGRMEGDAGELKLTIQKFYRIAGGSTQLSGVASDIVIPSVYDQDDIGEKALKNPLPYDEVPPVEYQKVAGKPLYIEELKQRSIARVEGNEEFKYIKGNLEIIKKRLSDNQLSLNREVRLKEIEKQKARKNEHLAVRNKRPKSTDKRFAVTLDNADKPELEPVQLVKNEDEKAKRDRDDDDLDNLLEDDAVDPVRDEALNILSDLVEFSKSRKTAAANASAAKTAAE